jgi:hypothetical protein
MLISELWGCPKMRQPLLLCMSCIDFPIRIEGFCATRLLTAGLTSSLGVIFLSRGKPLRHSVNAAGDGTAIAFFGRRDTAPTRSN